MRWRWRQRLIAAALGAGLADRRATLVGCLPDEVRDALPTAKRPGDQLRRDVIALDGMGAVDGIAPLVMWVEAALDMLGAHDEGGEALRAVWERRPAVVERGRAARGWRRVMVAGCAVGVAAWGGWPSEGEGWVAVPAGARAPAVGELVRARGDEWARVAGPCVEAGRVRVVERWWSSAARRVLDPADFEAARLRDDCVVALADESEGLMIVLETVGPPGAVDRAERWRGRPVEVNGWALEGGR